MEVPLGVFVGGEGRGIVLFKITRESPDVSWADNALLRFVVGGGSLSLPVSPLPFRVPDAHSPPPPNPPWVLVLLASFCTPVRPPKIPAVFCSGDVAEAITGVYTNHTGE